MQIEMHKSKSKQEQLETKHASVIGGNCISSLHQIVPIFFPIMSSLQHMPLEELEGTVVVTTLPIKVFYLELAWV